MNVEESGPQEGLSTHRGHVWKRVREDAKNEIENGADCVQCSVVMVLVWLNPPR